VRRLAASGYPSGIKHLFDARVHLLLFDEFPGGGLRDALLHGGAGTGILLKKAQGSFPSRSASRTGMVGDLGKLRFLLGSEMEFHTPFNGRESSRLSQRACLCAFRRRRGILRGKGRV